MLGLHCILILKNKNESSLGKLIMTVILQLRNISMKHFRLKNMIIYTLWSLNMQLKTRNEYETFLRYRIFMG